MNQYEFRNGHWVDAWNEGYTDEGPTADGECWATAVLPLCGCGNPDWVTQAMGAYLALVESFGAQRTPVQQIPDDDLAAYLLANMADQVGLTEHGTTIYWCWLTPAGKRWLELCRMIDWSVAV